MEVIKELAKIAKMNEIRIRMCTQIVENGFDVEELDLCGASLVQNCVEKNGHLYNSDGGRLDNCGLVDDLYYCEQHTGYIEDDYYGFLYYPTEEAGVFVKIPFATY